MSKAKILHITPWFKTSLDSTKAVFIYNHIASLVSHCDNSVLHVDFVKNKNPIAPKSNSNLAFKNISHTRITIPTITDSWREKEIKGAKEVNRFLKKNHQLFDIVNFHIPYPLAINIKQLLNKYDNLKFIFNEQWSAYHLKFSLPEGNKGRSRIEQIFRHNIPLNVVSKALGEDICEFIGEKIDFEVLPNIVESDIFSPKKNDNNKDLILCSVNNWSSIKNPLFLIDVFYSVIEKEPNAKLILGGNGYMIQEMMEYVETKQLEDSVSFLGSLSRKEVAETIQSSSIYIQTSNYETFSVVTAEAIMCGTPVVARSVGGMKDFITKYNGKLIDSTDPQFWSEKVIQMHKNLDEYNSLEMAEKISAKFSSIEVGEKYFQTLRVL